MLDKALEGWMATPHWLHPERFGAFIARTVIKVDEEGAMVRFGPGKVCYSGVGENLYPRIINNTPVMSFQNKVFPIPISLLSPGKLTSFIP